MSEKICTVIKMHAVSNLQASNQYKLEMYSLPDLDYLFQHDPYNKCVNINIQRSIYKQEIYCLASGEGMVIKLQKRKMSAFIKKVQR